jgi:hypothetical protein
LAGTPFLNYLAGTPLLLKMGAGMHQNGAYAALLSEKEVPAKFTIPKWTNQVFFQYRLVKYQENTNRYRPKIPNRKTTLHFSGFENDA